MKIALLIVFLAAVAGGLLWYRNEQRLEAMLAHSRAYEARTAYTASAFPVTVTFPRGGAMTVDYWGELNWKGGLIEAATCSGSTEEALYAEFRNAPAAFADAEHPLVKTHLGILFDKPSIPRDNAFYVIHEEKIAGGWLVRQTLVVSPHGGIVHPPEIETAVSAKWPVPPDYVRRPFRMPGTPPPEPTVYMKRFDREQAQNRRNAWFRDEKGVNEERRKKHHHFVMVEAIKDFGENRSVTIRKVGQYLDGKVFEQLTEVVKEVAGKVKAGF